MKPEIIEKQKMILAGYSFFGDPFALSPEWTEENEIGRLWKRFMDYYSNQTDFIKSIMTDEKMYEVHIENSETSRKGFFEVFVGFETEKIDDVPVDLLVKIIPPSIYAVFTLKGKQITEDWENTFMKEWFEDSTYQADKGFGMQVYDRRYKGMENPEDSVIELYVPVSLKK